MTNEASNPTGGAPPPPRPPVADAARERKTEPPAQESRGEKPGGWRFGLTHGLASVVGFSGSWFDLEEHAYILRFGKKWAELDEQARSSLIEANKPPVEWDDWYEGLRSSWVVDPSC